MPISLVLFLILSTCGVVALVCGGSILTAVRQGEGWAIASVIAVAVMLASLGVVV